MIRRKVILESKAIRNYEYLKYSMRIEIFKHYHLYRESLYIQVLGQIFIKHKEIIKGFHHEPCQQCRLFVEGRRY